jgi:predicted site-specific integrase-resolvase
MTDDLTTTEAAAYLAAQGFTVKRRRVGGSGSPSADTLKHWARDGKLAGARKRENRWFIPRETIAEMVANETRK